MIRFVAAIVLIVFGAATVFADEKSAQSIAAHKIQLLGGWVTCNEALPNNPVTSVSVQNCTRFNDKYLHILASLPDMTSLTLSHPEITDAGMKEVGKLKKLACLDLSNSQITDDGVKELKGLTNLTELLLNNTSVTGSTLGELKQLKKLRTLYLVNAPISEDGLRAIGTLEQGMNRSVRLPANRLAASFWRCFPKMLSGS